MLQAMSSQQSAVAGASSPTIDEIVLADSSERWAALGFTVTDGVVALGSVRLRLAGCDAGRGIVSWSLRALSGSGSDLDGLATTVSQSAPAEHAPAHANGISSIDHVV